MARPPSVKGQKYNAAKDYLIERFGPEALTKVLNMLSEKDRLIVEKIILDVSWQPETTFINFLWRIEDAYGKGDYKVCRQIGHFSAKAGISRFYKIFISFGNPAFVMSRAAIFWSHIHDHGKLETFERGPNAAIARLTDFKTPNKVFCHYLMGYCEGVLEMSGARNIAITEVKCAAEGSAYCEFVGNWEK